MKSSSVIKIVACLATFVACNSLFAQGSASVIADSTFITNPNIGVIKNESGSILTSETGYNIQIWGAVNDSTIANFTLLQSNIPIPFGDGRPGASTSIVLNGVFTGDTFNYLVRAWKTSSGADFASATISGQSPAVVSKSLTVGAGSPLNLDNWGTFQLSSTVVPEPSTIVLGLMGGLGLLLRRRK